MATIQIKDIPPETHAVFRRRAAEAHQSLQEYMRNSLIQQASRPTMQEWLAETGSHTGGSAPLALTTRLVREDRDRR